MTYIICEPCTKDEKCVEVCPVDCIHPKKDEPGFLEAKILYVNPAECIDCGACVTDCPAGAIFEESEVPEQWQNYKALNAQYFQK